MPPEQVTEAPARIELLGRKHPVVMPALIEREELLVAYGQHRERGGHPLLRVYCAMLGLCTRLGRLAKADYARSGCNVLVYGGEVYNHLRSEGATVEAIRDAAKAVLPLLAEALPPQEHEVEDKARFLGANAGPST